MGETSCLQSLTNNAKQPKDEFCGIGVIEMVKILVIPLVSVRSASCASWLLLHNVGLPAPRGGACQGDTWGRH